MVKLENICLTGRHEYPKSLVGAYNLVVNWKGGNDAAKVQPGDCVAFTTTDMEDEDFVYANSDKVIRK